MFHQSGLFDSATNCSPMPKVNKMSATTTLSNSNCCYCCCCSLSATLSDAVNPADRHHHRRLAVPPVRLPTQSLPFPGLSGGKTVFRSRRETSSVRKEVDSVPEIADATEISSPKNKPLFVEVS